MVQPSKIIWKLTSAREWAKYALARMIQENRTDDLPKGYLAEDLSPSQLTGSYSFAVFVAEGTALWLHLFKVYKNPQGETVWQQHVKLWLTPSNGAIRIRNYANVAKEGTVTASYYGWSDCLFVGFSSDALHLMRADEDWMVSATSVDDPRNLNFVYFAETYNQAVLTLAETSAQLGGASTLFKSGAMRGLLNETYGKIINLESLVVSTKDSVRVTQAKTLDNVLACLFLTDKIALAKAILDQDPDERYAGLVASGLELKFILSSGETLPVLYRVADSPGHSLTVRLGRLPASETELRSWARAQLGEQLSEVVESILRRYYY